MAGQAFIAAQNVLWRLRTLPLFLPATFTTAYICSLRTALRHKLKTEPAEHRPHIRNVITTLDIMLGKRPADEREAARKQTLRNIEHLERARAASRTRSADVA